MSLHRFSFRRPELAIDLANNLKGKGFAPFGEETMKCYREYIDSKATLTPQTIQATLDVLREKNLIWKSARGTYALEDTSWREWLKNQRNYS